MTKRLMAYVHVAERDADGQLTGREGTFGPEDDLSTEDNSWVEAAITNPYVWEGAESDAPTSQTADPADADTGVVVPTGTVDEVLAWVGRDLDRAARALAAERAGKNRSTLVAELQDRAAGE